MTTILKARKRPIVIEAWIIDKAEQVPDWAKKKCYRAVNSGEIFIETLEGTMKGKEGDYLLKGVNDEIYPCDKKVFEDSYDVIS
jgi:hypothetical protein